MQALKHRKSYRMLKCLFYLLLCAFIGCLLLLLSGLDTPNGILQARINYNIEKSLPLFLKEELYPNLLSQEDNLSTQADNWSETIILQSSMYMNTTQDPLSIFKNPWRFGQDGILQSFESASRGEAPNSSYYRYWQGFRVLIRPLLVVLDYSSIRELFRFIGWFLFCFTVIVLYRNAGMKFALVFCSSFLLIEYGLVTTTIQFSLSFYIALNAMILLPNILKRQWSIPFFFLMVGAATQFFDFYTVPCITLGLPLIFLVKMKRQRQMASKAILRLMIRCIIAWLCSYIGMWLFRMVLVSLFLHIDAFTPTFQSFFNWTGITRLEEHSWIGIFDAIEASFHVIFTKAHLLLLLSGFVIYIIFLTSAIRRRRIQKPDLLFLSVAIIPMIWMIAASIPTTWHIFFQYRSLVVFLFACFSTAISPLEHNSSLSSLQTEL